MTATETSPRTSGPRRPVRVRSSLDAARPRIVSAASGFFGRWWLVCLVLPMIVASDYKFRRRAASSALGGRPDSQILFEVGVYGLVALYLLLKRGRAPRLARTSGLLFAMWSYVAALCVSVLWSVYPMMAIVRGTQLLIVASLVQTIAGNATRVDLHRLAHGYLVLVSASIVVGYGVHGHLNNAVAGRFHWLYTHPVPNAIFLMIGTLMSLAYFRSAELRSVVRLWPRWAYAATGSWIGLALLLSKTRGALGGFLVGVIVLTIYRTRTRTKIDALVAATAGGALVALAFSSTIITYIERGQDIDKLATLNERTNLWTLAFDRFFQRPVTGWGLGASRGIFLDSIGLGGGHNAFVNVLVDGGLLAMVPFLAMLAFLLVAALRFRAGSPGRVDSLLIVPIVAGMLVDSMTAEFMAVPANNASIWLLVLIGWVSVLRRAERSRLAAI